MTVLKRWAVADSGVHTMTSSETPQDGDSVLAACGVGRRKITRAGVAGKAVECK